jgi:hypothetical protein
VTAIRAISPKLCIRPSVTRNRTGFVRPLFTPIF